MLLVFQFPIADVRSFFKEPGETKISLSQEMHDSLRGFGSKPRKKRNLTQEERDLLALWLGGDPCYTANQGLKFECKCKDGQGKEKYRQLNGNSLKNIAVKQKDGKEEGISGLKVAFRHFHFMQDNSKCNAIGRFEVGFFLKFPDDVIELRQMREACIAIANLQTRQYRIGPFAEPPDPKRADIYNPLYNSCKSIKNYFCASTTRIREKQYAPIQWRKRKKLGSFPHTGYIKEGIPVFIATLAENEVLRLPGDDGSDGRRGIAWICSDVPMDKRGNEFRGLFVLRESRGEQFNRRQAVRRCLSEINTQYQGGNLVIDLMQKHKAASRPYSDEMQIFQKFSTCITKKMKETLNTITKHRPFDTGFFIDPGAEPVYESLFRKFEDMDDEIKKAQRVELLKASESQDAEILINRLAEMEGMNVSILIVESGGSIGSIGSIGNSGTIAGRDSFEVDQTGGDKIVKFEVAVSGDTGTLKNQLEELAELIEKIPGVPEGLKSELKSFDEQVSQPNPEKINPDRMKNFVKNIIKAAESAQKFVVPITACVKCIAALAGGPMP